MINKQSWRHRILSRAVRAVPFFLMERLEDRTLMSGFTYDLRFAPGQLGVGADEHSVDLSQPHNSSYSLELWGQISGDTVFTNDSWCDGELSVASTQVGGDGALTGGGIVSAQRNTNLFSTTGSDGRQGDVSSDGISDWGSSDANTITSGWMFWMATSQGGLRGGTLMPGMSQPAAIDPLHTWEVLIANTVVNNAVKGFTWVDTDDTVSGTAIVQAVGSYAGGVSKSPNPTYNAVTHLDEPSDATGGEYDFTTFTASTSLWGSGPSSNDVNQGYLADCYFVASLASAAQQKPLLLQSLAVDLGDGTFAVVLNSIVARVSNVISTQTNHWLNPTLQQNSPVWVSVFEKAFAAARSGSNTYASISWGYEYQAYQQIFAGATYTIQGSPSTQSLKDALDAGQLVTMASTSYCGSPWVQSHVYTVMAVDVANDTVTLRNPWGTGGDDGLGTVTTTRYNLTYVTAHWSWTTNL